MKTILIMIAAFLISVIPSESKADCASVACDPVKVTKLYLHPAANGGAGTLFIATSGNEYSLDCAPNSGGYLNLYADTHLFKELYSMLLAALVSGKEVRIRLDSSANPCKVVYVVINQ